MFHESRGKGPKSCLTNIFDCMRVITGSGDRVSSWAAAVVVGRFYATCPWEMLLTSGFNQLLSQCGMCIPILFSLQFVVTFASHPLPSHD